VPNDGTALRDDLIAPYHQTPALASFRGGLKLHAEDWAFNGMRSSLEIAEAYGDHMLAMHRAGDMTPETSHRAEYPAFLVAREPELEA
jgi:hypothetical protein